VQECALVPKAGPAPADAGDAATSSGNGSVAPPGRSAALLRRLRLPRMAVELLEIAYNRRGRSMLRQRAAAFAPDFVYERHALHCRAGLDVARELGRPLVLEVNSPMVDEMRQLGLLRCPRRARSTERAVLGGADAVLAVTHVLRDMLIERGARPETVHVVPNGAEPDRYGPAAQGRAAPVRAGFGFPAGAFVLGFVGYVRPWHRLDLVLEVMCRPGFGALCLVLCGQGPALPSLRRVAAERGLEARFRAVGEVAPAELPPFVCAFDAALVPAINPYASPLKLFDSLAAGVVTLAPDQPNLREILTDGVNGVLFAQGSADALAGRLRALLDDPAAARRLGAAGRASLLANRWTWDGNAARVAAIFAALRRERCAR
jgi:glycosyltransferase involved in cell wall biosynthesis